MTMRFVRHKANVDWGLGVVSAEDGSNLHILFEAAGYKKIAKKVPVLIDVSDEEVPRGHRLRRREDWPAAERDAKRAQAKRDLPRRFDAFVQEFLAQYPNGFRSQQFEDEERAYKWKAVQYAREVLQKEELKRLFAAANYEEVIKRTRRVLGKTNLAFPNELMKFDDIASDEYGIVAERIIKLVSAGAGTPEALEALAVGLAPAGAAKWTICSLIPFLLEPETWPFVKPTFIERTEKATGIDVEYDSKPNARTYRLVRDLYEHVALLLGERGLVPRDFIDVQTFLWIASGMAREMVESRAASERA
jgi:hypothetical protein